MRIATWNCRRKLESKLNALLQQDLDVAVIQECSKQSLQSLPDGYQGLWLAGSEDQGLGLLFRDFFGVSNITACSMPSFVRIDISGPINFRLIAAWNCKSAGMNYPTQLNHFLTEHDDWFDGKPTILAGDLNSQSGIAMDKGKQNHALFAERLLAKGLIDAHELLRQPAPSQLEATYRHLNNVEHTFRLDYIFAPTQWKDRFSSIEIGSPGRWAALSDHSPVILTIQD